MKWIPISGNIVISAHRDEQHILFELSEPEFDDFREKLNSWNIPDSKGVK